MCYFCVHHVRVGLPTNVSEVHSNMILYSFLLGSHWSWRGSLYPLLYWGSLDPRTHWPRGGGRGQRFLGHNDRGSVNPRSEWPGGYSIGGSLKPTTLAVPLLPVLLHWISLYEHLWMFLDKCAWICHFETVVCKLCECLWMLLRRKYVELMFVNVLGKQYNFVNSCECS